MTVEPKLAMSTQRSYDRDTKGYVGHEMAIHHVEMKPIDGTLDFGDLGRKRSKVSGK
jgi:hypothetical protein